jgi:hypothetical protein
VKLILAALHFANLRNYESVIHALAQRGHHVHLIADEAESFGGEAFVERLAAAYPGGVTWGWAPSMAAEPWFGFAQKVRYALDYVRFLGPRYADVPKLRLRNADSAPRVIRWLAAGPVGHLGGRPFAERLLKWLEWKLPRSADSQAFLRAQAPDALLLTSLTYARSSQMEQLKAARALGVRTAASILSWDHLSSKSLLHIAPDITLVWNDVQRQEATEMHGLDPARVVVTGAQCYDQWFERRPSRTREAFCETLGLDPARRIVLYVCSTMSPVPDPLEPVFVREWAQAVRSSHDADLRDASILIRPHPERVREWKNITIDDLEHVVLHGRIPLDSDAKADYFDSLYFSDAVVGLCTSVFLEAAIVGRPVLTLLLPPYRMHQDGMAHFRYLQTIGGGLLHTAPDVSAHLEQLAVAVRGRGQRDERNQRFLREFIRPSGLDVASTPAFVDALERLVAAPAPSPDPQFAVRSGGDMLAAWLARAAEHGLGRWLMMDAVDDARVASERSREVAKQSILAGRGEKRRAKAEAQARIASEKAAIERDKTRAHRARWRRKHTQRLLTAARTRLRSLLGGGVK